jgi:hypothetical protein
MYLLFFYKDIHTVSYETLSSLNVVLLLYIVEQGRQCTCTRNIETRSCNQCCKGKAISITFSVCVFIVLVSNIQRACAILSSVTCSTVQYFSALSHKRHDFKKRSY